jgi:biotin operon repressor
VSLTSFIRDNTDVRERFQQEFQKPKFSVKKDMVAPPLTTRYSLVGTAFDYLLRFLLQRVNSNTIDKGYWVAEKALELLADDQTLFSKGEVIARTLTGNRSENSVKKAFDRLRKQGLIKLVPDRRGASSAWQKIGKSKRDAAGQLGFDLKL